MIFIVGCPRSGTTWLRRMLEKNPLVKTGPESHLFDKYIGPLLKNWDSDKNKALQTKTGLSLYLDENTFLNVSRKYVLELFLSRIDGLKPDELFIEKTPQHAQYLPEIMKLFPKCKIVHIVRDARDVVSSLLAASKSWGADWAPESAIVAARTWVSLVNAVDSSRDLIPAGQFYQLRYRDLVTSTLTEMKELSNFLNIHWELDALEAVIKKFDAARLLNVRGGEDSTKFLRKGRPGSWKTDLSLLQKFEVWYVAHKTMEKFGYVWKTPFSD